MAHVKVLRPWAFRVENIPSGTSPEGAKNLFEKDERSRLEVRSLVPAVDDPSGNGSLTATLLVRQPAPLHSMPRLLNERVCIDDDFYGFTPLHQPTGPIAADIIAITGLAGHAFASWAQPTGVMWLRDYLPFDVKNVRTIIYGYDSRLHGNEARNILFSLSKNFIHRLLAMRKAARCEDRPIVFVGHSLGCLIIKSFLKVLVEINGFSFNTPRLPVPSVIFFGSPNRGLETVALESLVKSHPSEDLIRELRTGSPTLEYLNDKFRHVANGISILSCYELLPTPTAIKMPDGSWQRKGQEKLMVPGYSALLGLPGEEALACNANHTQIAKVSRSENSIYYALKGAIMDVASRAQPRLATIAAHNYGISLDTSSPKKISSAASTRYASHAGASLASKPPSNKSLEDWVNLETFMDRDKAYDKAVRILSRGITTPPSEKAEPHAGVLAANESHPSPAKEWSKVYHEVATPNRLALPSLSLSADTSQKQGLSPSFPPAQLVFDDIDESWMSRYDVDDRVSYRDRKDLYIHCLMRIVEKRKNNQGKWEYQLKWAYQFMDEKDLPFAKGAWVPGSQILNGWVGTGKPGIRKLLASFWGPDSRRSLS